MFTFIRSVVFGFVTVSVLGATSVCADSTLSTAKNVIGKFVKISNYVPDNISPKSVVKVAVTVGTEASAIPAAVAGASAIGVTASTGTAIATLSGAAATNATLYAIGAPVASALGVTFAAPVVVGGAVVGGIALAVSWGVSSLLDED